MKAARVRGQKVQIDRGACDPMRGQRSSADEREGDAFARQHGSDPGQQSH
jgi:hypothetical protein